MITEDKQIKVYNSYKLALEEDGFETDKSYDLGLVCGMSAIFDNLSGDQCYQLINDLVKNDIEKHVPHHIIYEIMQNFKHSVSRGKDYTAYLKNVKENENERKET